jgi:hypothetical protein
MAKVCKSGGEGTFAERHGNGEVAPIPAVRGTDIEPRGSTPSCRSPASLDDLVGAGEQRLWDHYAQRLGGLEIDDQLKRGWLLDGQIGRLGALQNFVNIRSSAPVLRGQVCSV